ncbi:CopL family metal-binding regulatory protein [Lysobacter soli]|uniref:CopL family metal-binding regulatory protein n=1 Tax=Lysobacter soli TaxID=453783 RepID=UPI003CCDC25E
MLLRWVLILVLCTDGVATAWAGTQMAAASVAHATTRTSAVQREGAALADCEEKSESGSPSGAREQHDCDCSVTGCTCNCMLTFYPQRVAPLFAAHHTLVAVNLPPPLLPSVRHEISRVFRPPIG